MADDPTPGTEEQPGTEVTKEQPALQGPAGHGGEDPTTGVLREARGALAPPSADWVEEDDDSLQLPPHPTGRPSLLAGVRAALASGLVQSGEMVWLTGLVFKSAVTRPKGYWGEVRDNMYSALKLCWFPMVLATMGFGLGAPGLQGGNLYYLFGIPERLGSFFVMASVREFAPWIDAMIIAGVVGTAITADLGARTIREEIDAMEVLGVDPIRTLVLPRVISTAIITGLFDVLAVLMGIVGGYIASVLILGASTSGFVHSFFSEANIPDLWGSVVKTTLFGVIIGIVCCYKGLKTKGGPVGVGRAVNTAVVIAFALIWIVNFVFTNALLGFAPSTQVIH